MSNRDLPEPLSGQTSGTRSYTRWGAGHMKIHYLRKTLAAAIAAVALLVNHASAADLTLASSATTGGTITVNTPDSLTISVGSSTTRILTNAINLGGGTLKGGVMDNVATVSGLSGSGTSSTFVDANGVTIILRGAGTANTTADLTLASGVTVTGANQLLVGGGAGGGISQSGNTAGDGGGGGGGNVVLTTGNLSGTLALTAGGGGDRAYAGVSAGLVGENTSIGATTALGGGASGYQNGVGGTSSKTINGATSNFTGGLKAGNTGAGGGAGSSSNGTNGAGFSGGAGGAGTQITTGVVGLSTYLGSDTFGGGGGGGGGTGTYSASNTGGAGGTGGGGAGNGFGDGVAGTNGFGGGGGGAGGGAGRLGGAGGAGSVAIQYAYNSNVAAGALTLSGGITLNSTSTLDAVRSGGLIDVTGAITGAGGLTIASSASSGGVVRLSGSNTYGGNTTISGGILAAATSTALGSGSVSIGSGASLRLDPGAIVNNAITTTSTGSILFAGGGLQRTSSQALSTVAQLVAGGTGASVALDPAFAWSARIAGVTYSDVLDLTNTHGTIQILQMAYDDSLLAGGSEPDILLGWKSSGSWVNAIDGNIGSSGGSSVTNASGSYASLGILSTADYLGSWGRDTTTNTVWAVVNHNSEYASIIVVPEPGAFSLAGVGLALVCWTAARRRCRSAR